MCVSFTHLKQENGVKKLQREHAWTLLFKSSFSRCFQVRRPSCALTGIILHYMFIHLVPLSSLFPVHLPVLPITYNFADENNNCLRNWLVGSFERSFSWRKVEQFPCYERGYALNDPSILISPLGCQMSSALLRNIRSAPIARWVMATSIYTLQIFV